MNKNRSYCHC